MRRKIPTRCLSAGLALALAATACSRSSDAAANEPRQLRVCSDPNNLPFSNQSGEGFENRIAELIAAEMGASVTYAWWAQRRGFIRETLRAGHCDVVMGVPSSFELALPTKPVYRSTYVFVYRQDRGIQVRSFDDDILRRLKIGVHTIGDDYANPPPAHALGKRGIIHNVRGYPVFGDYSRPSPPSYILDALVAGEIDLAIIWGPFAGHYLRQHRAPLEMVPVSPQIDLPFLPFVFDISLGVRRGEEEFKEELEAILDRKRVEIDAILAEYGVPRVDRRRRGTPAAPQEPLP